MAGHTFSLTPAPSRWEREKRFPHIVPLFGRFDDGGKKMIFPSNVFRVLLL